LDRRVEILLMEYPLSPVPYLQTIRKRDFSLVSPIGSFFENDLAPDWCRGLLSSLFNLNCTEWRVIHRHFDGSQYVISIAWLTRHFGD
jgi:hypothetical protein